MSPEPLDRRGYKSQEYRKKSSSGKYVLIAVIVIIAIGTILLATTPTTPSKIVQIEKTAEEIHESDSTLSPDQIQAEVEARNIFASVHKKQERLIEECDCFTSDWDSLGVIIPDNSKCTYTIQSACGLCGTYYIITAIGKKEEWGTFEMTHKQNFRRVD